MNPMNDVKIVQPYDIYNDSDIIGTPQMFQKPTASEDAQNSGNNITFAPVIKINTNDVVEEQQQEPITIDDNEYIEDVPIQFTEMKSKEPKEPKEPKNIIDAPIDFSKGLIIKKV
jgi:hypothetical protein